MHGGHAYGNWGIVITLVGLSLFFVLRYIPMRTRMEKRSGGAFLAFLAALFTEMYGFPLTIYLLSHFFGVRIPLDHISGHLLGDLISRLALGNGWLVVMIASNILLGAGALLVTAGWRRVYQSEGGLVTDGVYRFLWHPQYTGIFLITLGFIVQWPTVATLLLWPFVIVMYVRLAKREEKDVLVEYPEAYAMYRDRTPMFFPRFRDLSARARPSGKRRPGGANHTPRGD